MILMSRKRCPFCKSSFEDGDTFPTCFAILPENSDLTSSMCQADACEDIHTHRCIECKAHYCSKCSHKHDGHLSLACEKKSMILKEKAQRISKGKLESKNNKVQFQEKLIKLKEKYVRSKEERDYKMKIVYEDLAKGLREMEEKHNNTCDSKLTAKLDIINDILAKIDIDTRSKFCDDLSHSLSSSKDATKYSTEEVAKFNELVDLIELEDDLFDKLCRDALLTSPSFSVSISSELTHIWTSLSELLSSVERRSI